VLTGSEAERDLVEAVRRTAGVPVHSLAGELSVPELAALIERASILLSNNTAPVHLAAGVGTPVVVLYALTNPQHTPWGVPSRVLIHDVPCRFCYRSVCPQGHHRCLRGIEPVTVVDALHELWRSTRGELRGTDRPVAGRVVPIDTPPVRLPVPATLG
ncbi:MAG TPA: glycosyltransferase family 9 protein, partial [Actinomycetota bacterium]|nr:glycosyltransferase family 9 protein [Actinomycetota bacterium]